MSSVEQYENGRITVFGSSATRVEPDIVSLQFAVSRHAAQAADALRDAQSVSGDVQNYLSEIQIRNVGISQVNLGNYYDRGVLNGYQATYNFHILLQDLSRLQELMLGVIESGANLISSVNFQTTELKAIRAKARQQAIKAAYEKALIYCEAAGVKPGKVVRIDDQNPDYLQNRQRYGGHMSNSTNFSSDPLVLDESEATKAVNPMSIVVAAAVQVTYEINALD